MNITLYKAIKTIKNNNHLIIPKMMNVKNDNNYFYYKALSLAFFIHNDKKHYKLIQHKCPTFEWLLNDIYKLIENEYIAIV